MRLYKAFLSTPDGLRALHGDVTFKVGGHYQLPDDQELELGAVGYHGCPNPVTSALYFTDSELDFVMTEVDTGDAEMIKGAFDEAHKACFRSFTLLRIVPLDEWTTGIYQNFAGVIYRYKDGMLHSEGALPAIEYIGGAKYWYNDGEFVRENGTTAVGDENRPRVWLVNGPLLCPQPIATVMTVASPP